MNNPAFNAEERPSNSKTTQHSLSVAHPRPHAIDTTQDRVCSSKVARKSEVDPEDLASPDALYFGKRSRRTYGHTSRRSIAIEPLFMNLKTSSRIQKVQDEDMST